MEANCTKLTERILQLTLEIIYLLTGEDNILVWKPSGDGQNSIIVPLRSLMIPERNNNKRILEINQKMIELLTGEVSGVGNSGTLSSNRQGMCLDVSIKEWRYKDVMMEDHQTATSSDGSSNGNPPERCPRPLYSYQDSTQEDLTIPHHHQSGNFSSSNINIKEEIKEGEEADRLIKQQESLEGHKELYKDVMMASQPALTSPDGSSNGNPPERYPHPLYSHQESTQEGLTIPHHHQGAEASNVKTEVKEEEEMYVKENHQCMKEAEMMVTKEESSLDVSTGTHEAWNTQEEHLILPPDYNGVNNGQPSFHSADEAPGPSQPKETSCNNFYVTQKDDSFTKEYDPFLHQRTHTSEKPFSCSECNKSFTHSSLLYAHQRIHTEEKPFSCLICEKSFNKKRGLVLHERIHTQEKPFSCSECKKSFTFQSHLTRHQKWHTGEKRFSCSECGKSFTFQSQLSSHLRRHTGEKPFSCSECGKSFSQKSLLNGHQNLHTGEKPFSCSVCRKSFTFQSQLSVHHMAHTRGKKPFPCSMCERSFATNAKLIQHKRIHTGEKPFSCSECGKSFREKSVLNAHLRVHTGEKPFSCSECGKCFSNRGNRNLHMKMHTGEKPFTCPECGKCFAQKVSLILHQDKHAA